MIQEIEIKETSINENNIMIINLETSTMIQIQNNTVIQNKKITTNIDILNLIKKFTIHWDNEYKNNSILDGKTVTIKISTKTEIEKYTFKNKYPHNYNEFIRELKKLVIKWH